MKQEKSISSIGIEQYISGVEAVFTSREEYVCNITVFQKKRNKLVLVLQKHGLSFEESKSILKKTGQFSLIITGKGIIHKKLNRYYENSSELTNALLPDAKSLDFCAQGFECNGLFYGSVIRKEMLYLVLDQLAQNKLFPSSIIIGPYLTALLPRLTEIDQFALNAYQAAHVFEEGKLAQITSGNALEEQTVQVGEDNVSSFNVPGLCACVNEQTNAMVLSLLDDVKVTQLLTEAKQKRRFKLLLTALTAFIFVIVTSNFFINQHFSDQYSNYDEQLALNRQTLDEISKLEKDIDSKKSLLGRRMTAYGPVISIMCDQLSSTVPSNIKLRNLEVFPVSGKIQKDKPIGFSFNKITVEGTSSQSEILDSWISTCKKFDWVKDVQLVNYAFDQEKKGLFKLELLLQ